MCTYTRRAVSISAGEAHFRAEKKPPPNPVYFPERPRRGACVRMYVPVSSVPVVQVTVTRGIRRLCIIQLDYRGFEVWVL